MKKQTFIDRAQRLCRWASGDDKIFFINGFPGHSIELHGDILHMYEDDGGEKGAFIRIPATSAETFSYDEAAYQFNIVTASGDGYDIESYLLLRFDFPGGE